MTTIRGPIDAGTIDVYKGESWKPQITIRDGARTAALPFGTPVDVSAGTIKAILRIDKPDGVTDVTRDTSVAAEGEKTDGPNGVVTFFVASTVTSVDVAASGSGCADKSGPSLAPQPL